MQGGEEQVETPFQGCRLVGQDEAYGGRGEKKMFDEL